MTMSSFFLTSVRGRTPASRLGWCSRGLLLAMVVHFCFTSCRAHRLDRRSRRRREYPDGRGWRRMWDACGLLLLLDVSCPVSLFSGWKRCEKRRHHRRMVLQPFVVAITGDNLVSCFPSLSTPVRRRCRAIFTTLLAAS